MKKSRVFLLTLFASLSLNTLASGWTSGVKIEEITLEHRDGENDIYFKLSSDANTVCTNKSLVLISADTNDKMTRLYALGVSAKMTGSNVSFFVSDDCDAGGIAKTSMMKVL